MNSRSELLVHNNRKENHSLPEATASLVLSLRPNPFDKL